MAALLAIGFTVGAQTNPPPPSTPQNFVQSAIGFIGTVDTNMAFAPFLLWDEVNYQNQVDVSDGLGVSYDVLKPASYYAPGVFSLSLEAVMRNIGVAGQIAGGQGGLGANWNYYNIRIGAYADGGYSPVWHQGYAEVGVRLLKKPTPNTFLGIGMSYDLPQTSGGQQYPLVGVFAGATF